MPVALRGVSEPSFWSTGAVEGKLKLTPSEMREVITTGTRPESDYAIQRLRRMFGITVTLADRVAFEAAAQTLLAVDGVMPSGAALTGPGTVLLESVADSTLLSPTIRPRPPRRRRPRSLPRCYPSCRHRLISVAVRSR